MSLPWFKDGLHFKCTGCGKCCTGSPGYVFLSEKDLLSLSLYLNLSLDEFTLRYTRKIEGQVCLIDAPDSADCIFLKENRCTVYANRPLQCSTFPWWLNHLRSSEDWEKAATHCEGINHPEAPLISGGIIARECIAYLDNFIEKNF